MHLTRYSMYKGIGEVLSTPLEGDILGISGIANIRHLISESANIRDAQYPDIDVQRLPFEDSSFDCVITDQVLEHLEDPAEAISESYRVLREGGIAIHTTCFLNAIHPAPVDLWRFSKEALTYLCKDFERIIDCGSWGNRIAINLCFFGLRAMRIPDRRYSLRRMIATYNETDYPIVTWIIAMKTGSEKK